MAERGRRKLLACLWAACGMCLVSFGCQAQVSFLGGPLPPDGIKSSAAGNATAGDIVRTSYQPGERLTPQALPSGLIWTNGMPDLKPVDPQSRVTVIPGRSPIRIMPVPDSRDGESPEQVSTIRVTGVDGDTVEVVPPQHGGCRSCERNGACPGGTCPGAETNGGERPIPTELAKVSLPPYMIEPPDILLIDALRLVPKPPYVVQPLDVLFIRVAETLKEPIDGPYAVSPDGTINLGFNYGTLSVAGLTVEMVEEALRKHLGRVLKNPQVAVYLAQFRGVQQVRGEHLVRPDGTISLGSYGCVYVTGLTIQQAKLAIERHLSQYLLDPEVSVDVFAYNSKAYYVIADGGGFGQQVYRFPITGNETVLDAIGRIGGLPVVSSKKHIWVARPSPANHCCDQVLPVDWNALTQGGSTGTNYQLFPGDRIYVKADPLIHLDNAIAKVVSPIERLFGVTLLGSATVNSFRRNGNGTNNGTGAVLVP